MHFLQWRSLKTRVTIFTLVIFLSGIWVLALYASQILRHDLERLLGEQQLSTASFIAGEINDELMYRRTALEQTAAGVAPAVMANPAALQAYLESKPILQGLFNGGTFVVGRDGIATASLPLSADRLGVSYLDRDFITSVLNTGAPTIGKPVMGKKIKAPIVVIAVPIRDAQGRVLGALSGVTSLGMPNFLDKVSRGGYGKQGTYLLVAPQHRLFVTSSETSRIMTPLPPVGVNVMQDRFVQGFEGYGISVNAFGQEQLAAAKGIPIAGWYLGITLPTEVAFGPIRALQLRVQLAAIALSLLAAALTWWMLKRQLSPILATVQTLGALASTDQPLQPLPVYAQDEIGQLIGGVNHLIRTLVLRNNALEKGKAFTQSVVDSVIAEIAVLDRDGVIVAVNAPWRQFASANGAVTGQDVCATGVGANYLEACRLRADMPHAEMGEAGLGIQAVLQGHKRHFSLEYPCHAPHQYRWFRMMVTPLGEGARDGVVITHTDISERKQAEEQLRESDRRLRDALDASKIGEWELDLKTLEARRSRRHGEIFGQTIPLPAWGMNSLEEHMHPQDRPWAMAKMRESILTRSDWYGELRIVRDDLVERWVWIRAHVEVDQHGLPSKMHGMISDITERKLVEEELRIAATAFESQTAMMITDPRGTILQVNRAFCDNSGYTEAEVLGQSPRLLQSGQHDQGFYQQMWDVLQSAGAWQGEIWNRRKGGQIHPAWLAISAVKEGDGGVTHYIGTYFDITERKNAESAMLGLNRELSESRQRLRELAAQNEATLEEERKHIAREVHDELGQVLTALRMDISLMRMRFGVLDPAVAEKAMEMKVLVDRAIQGVRNVATNLRPTALDMGLVSALEWLCSEFTQKSGVVCALHTREESISLDESRAVVVFRIVQESLTNVARYAQANSVRIHLGHRGHELWVEVRDDGLGFDMEVAMKKKSFGLLGMRERALALGGKVSIHSAPGQGTVISVTIPIHMASNTKEAT